MKTILKNKNIFFLLLIGFLRNFLIIMPILTLYFQSKGLNIQEIMILQVIFSVIIVAFEVPSWYFADIYSLQTSLLVSVVIFGILKWRTCKKI